MSDFLTVKETAEKLKLSPRSVYRLIAAKVIKAVRIGGAVRIPVAALEEYLGGL